jgi:hypothetical protein
VEAAAKAIATQDKDVAYSFRVIAQQWQKLAGQAERNGW